MKYLKQFVRSLDEQSLGKFLHFVTGFNTAPTKMIKVTFTGLDGLAHRPIAHTCGPVLELPCTYKSYPDFRKEMESILSNTENFEMSICVKGHFFCSFYLVVYSRFEEEHLKIIQGLLDIFNYFNGYWALPRTCKF